MEGKIQEVTFQLEMAQLEIDNLRSQKGISKKKVLILGGYPQWKRHPKVVELPTRDLYPKNGYFR
jgi:hypothetical protein